MERRVSARLSLQVAGDVRLVMSVAVARCEGLAVSDRLTLTSGERAYDVQAVEIAHHGVLHVAHVPAGNYQVTYDARVLGFEACPPDGLPAQLGNLVPSRYAESDRLFGIARELFEDCTGAELVLRVREWVARRTAYVAGSSRVTDGATETYLQRSGVCRDFAHLVVAILRARGVPARLVTAYAPGLVPMDFHAVVEAYVDGAWWVLDATGLAPRQSLLRIATGRDAAETSFLSSFGARVDLRHLGVTAWLEGNLPQDNHSGLVLLGR